VCNICDIMNICSYYEMYDCSLEVEVDCLVGVGFMRCFVMRSLKMQLWLFKYALIDWLVIFCMACVMYRKDVFPWNQYCGPSSIPCINRKTVCIVRKGEKQIQILDDY
jgi:hypothetical protein